MDDLMTFQKIFIGLVLGFSLFAQNVSAKSSVWKVSQGEHYFYVGGTIHVLSDKDYPLPPAYNQAYQDASKLVFESDFGVMQGPAFQAKMSAATINVDGKTLEDQLSPKTYHQLSAFFSARKLSIANFSKYTPWSVSLIMSMIEMQRLGMRPELGLDMHFYHLAVQDHKSMMGLETADQQLNFLISMGADDDPDQGIRYTLKEMENFSKELDQMRQYWRDGDIDGLSKMDSLMIMKKDFPESYDTLLTQRNNAWMKKIPLFIEDKQVEFVLVGLMHLAGENGLINQLKSKGFIVEQL